MRDREEELKKFMENEEKAKRFFKQMFGVDLGDEDEVSIELHFETNGDEGDDEDDEGGCECMNDVAALKKVQDEKKDEKPSAKPYHEAVTERIIELVSAILRDVGRFPYDEDALSNARILSYELSQQLNMFDVMNAMSGRYTAGNE